MKKILLTWIAIGLSCLSVMAQTKERPFALGAWGGLTQYNGDLGNGFYDMSQVQYGHIGLNAAWYVTPRFDFVMNATYGSIGYAENDLKHFHGEQIQWNAHFNLNLLTSDSHRIIPYLLGGVGAAYYPKKYEIVQGMDLFATFGGGVRIKVTSCINLHLQESFGYTDHDDRDGESHFSNDGFVMHSIGLTYSFPGPKDADKDGVSDKNDKCPNTPVGVKVDEKGCPLDRDADGIADYLDACPDLKGTIAMKGCPDRDGDLVVDSLDKCPDVAGLAALKGCPDKDGDGIADKEDNCPDVFGVKELKGCPLIDTDMDGIADKEDACPAEKGLAALKGCPDKDNDGVADKDDKCPDIFGLVLNSGCPDAAAVKANAPAEIKQNIHFETGKDILTKKSKQILDNLSKILIAHPDYKLNIDGHTDNTGNPESNITLSQARAEIVKAYLTNKSIDGSRLTTKGYGQTKPITNNNTSNGRAENRRVEFNIN